MQAIKSNSSKGLKPLRWSSSLLTDNLHNSQSRAWLNGAAQEQRLTLKQDCPRAGIFTELAKIKGKWHCWADQAVASSTCVGAIPYVVCSSVVSCRMKLVIFFSEIWWFSKIKLVSFSWHEYSFQDAPLPKTEDAFIKRWNLKVIDTQMSKQTNNWAARMEKTSIPTRLCGWYNGKPREVSAVELNIQFTYLHIEFTIYTINMQGQKKNSRRCTFIVCNPRTFSKECTRFIRVGNPQLILWRLTYVVAMN